MSPTVVVVGGGYAGIAVASALDDVAHVVLVEPRDAFVHNVAALRGLVDPNWTDRLFMPYDRLLPRGQVVHDWAVEVEDGAVTLSSGERITADYVVLASGSAYPFPAKLDSVDSAVAKARIRATRDGLAHADRVLLLGAGPVGLELAGEIKAVWATKAVTIVDPADDIISGAFSDEFRTSVRDQLDALGVELVLGSALRDEPAAAIGEVGAFTVNTQSGRAITADIWFRCFGVVPATDYVMHDLTGARRPDGHLEVAADLRLPGQHRVFAIGDVVAIEEAKTAKAAGQHAEVVATNIRALIAGEENLATYQPDPPGIVLPLGPRGGASYAPHRGVLDADTTSQIKGADLRVDSYRERLGLSKPGPRKPRVQPDGVSHQTAPTTSEISR